MATDFKIDAELRVKTKAAASGLATLSSKLSSFGSALRGSEGMFGSMVSQAVAFGGAYIGVNAMVGGFAALATSAFEFQKEVGGAQLGLQTIMSQVEGITDAAGNWHPVGFEAAARLSAETYGHLQDMAVTSSATSAELLGIFQSTYGAARSAGASMGQVYELTANAATAAAALGVDFQQAQRDMGAMLRGGAGLDVKLFSSLRSMNAIAMDAKEFNKLSPAERVATLATALRGFEAANEAYGRSLPGALSTTQDLFELFRGAFFGPSFQMMADVLNELNGSLMANKDAIKSYLATAGGRFRDFLAAGVSRAREAFSYVSSHWNEIVEKVTDAVERVRTMAPIIASWAAVFVKMRLAAMALGVALQSGAWLASIASTLTSVGGYIAAAGSGAATAGALGSAGATGAAASLMGAEVGASLSAFGTALSALAWPLTALAGIVISLWQGFETYKDRFLPMLGELGTTFSDIGQDLMAIFGELWDFLQPIFAGVGAVILTVVIAALRILGGVLRVIVAALRFFASIIGWVGRNVIKPVFDAVAVMFVDLVGSLGWFGDALNTLINKIYEFFHIDRDAEERRRTRGRGGRGERAEETTAETESAETTANPDGRTTVHNDFRGSKITVEQSFREADPDRVAVRMIEDIARFAEQRVQSGFAPALTR